MKIIINNKSVEIGNVEFTQVSVVDKGSKKNGVSAYIRSVIDGAAKVGHPVKIVTLSALLLQEFKADEKAGKKGLPEDQVRQRINNMVSGSKGMYVKVYTDDGYVAVTTKAAWEAKSERKAKATKKTKVATTPEVVAPTPIVEE